MPVTTPSILSLRLSEAEKELRAKWLSPLAVLYLLFIFGHEKYFIYALLSPSGETQVINTLHH